MGKNEQKLIVIVQILLVIGVVYNVTWWLRYRACTTKVNAIEYSLIEVNRHNRARGDYYSVTILSNGEQHEVDITGKMATQFKQGKAPALYRCANDEIISEWTVSLKLRLALLFTLGLVILMIVWIKRR